MAPGPIGPGPIGPEALHLGIQQGPGGPRARAPSFPRGYFLETGARILTTPTFKEKLSLQASRPFPGGALRKVSMFKIYLAGRSSDMSVSCPETVFFSPKWQDSGCGFFKVLTLQEHKLLACQDTSFLHAKTPAWLAGWPWLAALAGWSGWLDGQVRSECLFL